MKKRESYEYKIDGKNYFDLHRMVQDSYKDDLYVLAAVVIALSTAALLLNFYHQLP